MQILRMFHGMMIHLPLRNTSQQHQQRMTSDPKIQFQIDHCASMKDLMSQILSYPYPYRTTTFRMDLPQSTPQGATVLNYEQMDFSEISFS